MPNFSILPRKKLANSNLRRHIVRLQNLRREMLNLRPRKDDREKMAVLGERKGTCICDGSRYKVNQNNIVALEIIILLRSTN